MTAIVIGLFGALGCLARWGIEEVVERRDLSHRAYATMFINVAGTFVVGFLTWAVYSTTQQASFLPNRTAPYLITGFCGGFTTFSSAIAIPAIDWSDGSRLRAVILVGVTPLLCVVGFWIGITL
jgi:CrcB protein